MGLFSSECENCGSKEHATSDCPHDFFSSNKCRHCGSVNHATDDCPHGFFSSNKCRHCGSLDHATDDCPHGVFSSNECRHCGSLDHASDDCPHGVFSLNKCRHCGSLNHASDDCPHGIFGSSSSSRTTSTTQTSSSSSDDSGCTTAIIWLVGIGVAVFVVVWLAVNVVLPIALLNSALALVVLSFVFKKYKTLFISLALVGGGYMLLDITNGWLSVNFVEKVVKNPDWISAIVYVNAVAIGLSTWLLIKPIWLKTEQMEPAEKRKSLLIKGALILLVAILTGIAPVIFHIVQNPFISKGTNLFKEFQSLNENDNITDIDGNVYHTVKIGTQTWMVENLKTTKFNDGTTIPHVSDNITWSTLVTPAYCWNNNLVSNKDTYGALYNWYAVNTGKLCPKGWRVPTDTDWTILANFLGGETYDNNNFESKTGGKLKESGTIHWSSPNEGATNETGFTGLPGGGRSSYNGNFSGLRTWGEWWSSTEGIGMEDKVWWTSEEGELTPAWTRNLSCFVSTMNRSIGHKREGYSVRCVRDN